MAWVRPLPRGYAERRIRSAIHTSANSAFPSAPFRNCSVSPIKLPAISQWSESDGKPKESVSPALNAGSQLGACALRQDPLPGPAVGRDDPDPLQ